MASINVLPILRLFHLLAPHERRGVASVLRQVSSWLDHTAELDERRARPPGRGWEWLSSLPALIREIMDTEGVDYDAAARDIEELHEVPRDTIDAWHERDERRRARDRRQERDFLILQLVRKGWAKAKIARRVGLTPARVGQIVKAHQTRHSRKPMARPNNSHIDASMSKITTPDRAADGGTHRSL